MMKQSFLKIGFTGVRRNIAELTISKKFKGKQINTYYTKNIYENLL